LPLEKLLLGWLGDIIGAGAGSGGGIGEDAGIRLAGIMAMRLEILTEARTLGDFEDESEAPS